jgi:Flp pilus assembly protein TadB
LWYTLLVGLSILVMVQWDPAWRSSRPNRHYGRLAATGLIAVTALVWHQNEPWLAIGLGLVIGTAGLVWRVRAWLYVGTITFGLSNCYQLVVLITEQPMTKWAIGLLAGILIIALAANFERRREQINQALQHWLDRLQEWQ